jgi:hypothetical protein
MSWLAWIPTLGLLLPLPVQAGMVQTATGRWEGMVALGGETVKVGDRQVAWSEVLYLRLDDAGRASTRPQRVLLKNGERWSVELVRLADKQLVVRSELFGEKKFDPNLVAALEFAAPPASHFVSKPRTLYRTRGEPIPGPLLSFDTEKLSIDSPFGVLNLDRDGLISYAFAEPTSGAESQGEEVVLLDGTILRGRFYPASEESKLDHPLLGTVKLPNKIVSAVVRHTPAMLDLTEQTPRALRTWPLTAADRDAAVQFQVLRGDRRERLPRTAVKGLQIEPKTVVRFPVLRAEGKSVRLCSLLVPANGMVGDAVLRVRAGKEVLLEREAKAGGAAIEVAVEVPAAVAEIEIEIDFGTRLRFPCGVVLADPHLVFTKP